MTPAEWNALFSFPIAVAWISAGGELIKTSTTSLAFEHESGLSVVYVAESKYPVMLANLRPFKAAE